MIAMNWLYVMTHKIWIEIKYRLPKKFAHSIIYRRTHGVWADLNHPSTYDEKIHWLMVNLYNESYGKYADKYAVREYVRQRGLEELLIPVYGSYERADDIDFEGLPKEFVLMANHGSGDEYYEICTDREEADLNQIRAKMAAALKKKYGKNGCEYQYKNIDPKILCMKLLKSPDGDRLTDYKVVCVNGKPSCILVCTNRDAGRDYYTPGWEYLEYVSPEYQSGCTAEKPKCLEQMLRTAAVLAEPFPLARIDFYEEDGRLYFGEVTLTPSAGNHKNLSKRAQLELGKEILLPDKCPHRASPN